MSCFYRIMRNLEEFDRKMELLKKYPFKPMKKPDSPEYITGYV